MCRKLVDLKEAFDRADKAVMREEPVILGVSRKLQNWTVEYLNKGMARVSFQDIRDGVRGSTRRCS